LRGRRAAAGFAIKPLRHSILREAGNEGEDSMNDHPIVEIEFAELSDGSLVEMIEDPADPAKSLLAVYRDQIVRYAEKLVDQGRTLVPLRRSDDGDRHIRFPQGAESYGQITDLLTRVASFFSACLDLEKEWWFAMAAIVLSTWLPEKLPVASYLAFVGPPGSGKTTAMRILNLLCYRSVLTADISSSAFYDISHRFRPTILIDETLTAGRPRELIHLLKASSTPGVVSLRKNKARLAYGPKIFSWLCLPDDPALNSRCLIVPMHKTSRTDLKAPNHPRVLEIAKKVRMQLLQYRFENYKNLSVPKTPPNVQLFGRPLDLYRALSLPFDKDADMCKFLGALVADQNKLQTCMLSPVQASAIRVLYNSIHTHRDAPGFWLKALTAAVKKDLTDHGESAGFKERKFGDILTSLFFTNRTRMNAGYVLWLNRADRERIHATARDYEMADPIRNCDICAEAGALAATDTADEAQTEKDVPTEASKGEHRERRERGSRGKIRLRASASSRSRPLRS
jgi:hypothetical protein